MAVHPQTKSLAVPFRPVKLFLQAFLLLMLSSILSMLSTTVQAQTVEIGSGTLDETRESGPKWTRVNFIPPSTGDNVIRVTSSTSSDIRFSVFRILDAPSPDNTVRIGTSSGSNTLAEWSGALDTSEQYYLGIWAVSGSGDFTATIDALADLEIVTQPSDLTVTEGDAATFSVVAAGSGTLTYQWYLNDQTISGETTDTLNILATTSDDNGNLYRVDVTDANSTLSSVGANLEVLEATQTDPSTGVSFGQGTVDQDRVAGPRWVRLEFNSIATATHTIRVVWDSNADVRFRVFESNGTPVSSAVLGTNPGLWSGELEANTEYYIGLWSASGVANYEATVEADVTVANECAFAETPPQLIQEPTIDLNQVMDYGIADFQRVLGQRHNVINFSPEETGPVTIALQWEGEESMNLAVFDSATDQRLALANDVCVSGSTSSKAITLDLQANKQYHATAWIQNGSAEWVIRKIQTVVNPNFGISDAPDSAQRPNIVLINTDDQRAKTLSFMPSIQELLVDKGTSYPNTIVPTPSCCPSRATTLSGQYVHNNNQFQQQRVNVQIFERTFQKYLKEAGYFTGHAGKYLHWVAKSDPPPPYWDRWTYISGGFYGVDMNFDGQQIKPGGYTTDITFERTKDYLREFEQQNDDNPWFVYIAPTSPHSPWTAEYDFRNTTVPELDGDNPAYLEADISDKPSFFRFRSMNDAEARHEHEARARNLLSLDREIAEFIEYLEASGELDNTLIIFTSDNGYILGEHQTQGKFTPYRDSVQVPLVISWPGQVAEGVVSGAFVSHVDIAPTILDAAGIDTSTITFDGRNLFDESRDTFFMEYFLDPEANGGRIGDWASLRTETYQYTEWYANDGSGVVTFREYYDMTNDPFQLENLYENGDPADDPDFTNLSAQLLSARVCVGDDCP